jgi:hypothetical protein
MQQLRRGRFPASAIGQFDGDMIARRNGEGNRFLKLLHSRFHRGFHRVHRT